MAQTKPKAGQFYGVSDNGTDGQFLKTDGTGGMSWDSPITNPTITSIDYPGSATAADPAGGESVIINGTLFASGITCTVGGTSAVTAFNSATQITITTPAKAAGPYTVAVLNPNGGTASQANFIQYSGVPVWSTAAGTLGNVIEGAAASFQVTATEGSDTIEYAVTTGTLPTGLSLATATGAITGTAPAVSADTTTTFSITATDDENQTSASRSFSITVQNDAPSNHFNTVLYTGSGTTQSISSLNFSPGLVWIKARNIADNNFLADSVRGANKLLQSNNTAVEITTTGGAIASFDTNGFTLQATPPNYGINLSPYNFVAWNFKAGGAAVANTDGTINSQVSVNNSLGFSIVSYTGNGSSGNVGHGLNAIPELIIAKNLDGTNAWVVRVNSLGNGYLTLNATSSYSTTSLWGNPTNSVFNFTHPANGQTLNNRYIAYCFTSKPGFSKVGSYTGARPNDVLVQTGFQPAFVMIKASNATDDWFIVDDKREGTSAPTKNLYANTSGAESSFTGVQFLTNGFKLVGSANSGGTNNSGTTFIYLAIAADGSTVTPSLANSFATELYTGNGGTQAITGTGFKPDLSWVKNRNTSVNNHNLADSIRGANNIICSNLTNAQYFNSTYQFNSFDTDGITVTDDAAGNYGFNGNNETYVSWNWKAGGGTPAINTDGTITSLVSANQAAGFSIVKWTGTNAINTIGHGLSSAPELILIKSLDVAADWQVYAEPIGNNYKLALNTSGAKGSTTRFDSTNPTTSVFTFRDVGITGDQIAYCFKSISGYSKVGSYTGAVGRTVNVGFDPRFILFKNTSAGQWWIYDSVRGDDKRLFAESTAAESTSSSLTTSATGFTLNDANGNLNANGNTYIYLAIA